MNYLKENGNIYKVEQIGAAEIKSCIGYEKRLELISEGEAVKIYEWQQFNLEEGKYITDNENSEIVEIEGKEYKADKGKIIVPKALSKSESKIKELEEMIDTLGKQLVKERMEGIKKDKTISELGKHESKLSMKIMKMKNEVNAIKQALAEDKKGGE